VSGTRDAFATPEELTAATAAIPGPVTHRWLEGRDHGLRGGDAAVVEVVRDFVADVRDRHPRG
jgi:predicted alpha/beta-hydrolase family hydrolase